MLAKVKSISHDAQRAPWLTLSLTFFMGVLYVAGKIPFELFVFDRVAIGNGEVWRLLTAHIVHCSFGHLFWDLAAFIILGGVIEIYRRSYLISTLAFSCLGVSVWLWFNFPYISSYCGLSGALNGLLVMAVIIQWKRTGNVMYILVLAATVGKIFFEFTTHQTIFTNLSYQAVPGAHLAGFIAGGTYLFLCEVIKKVKYLTLQ